MRYLDREGVWLLSPPLGESCEILVPGNATAPSGDLLEFANQVVLELPSLRGRAVMHIEEFAPRVSPSGGGEWYLEGLDFGYPEALPKGMFRLCFSNSDDTYGEWSVFFTESSSVYFPVKFSRAQV